MLAENQHPRLAGSALKGLWWGWVVWLDSIQLPCHSQLVFSSVWLWQMNIENNLLRFLCTHDLECSYCEWHTEGIAVHWNRIVKQKCQKKMYTWFIRNSTNADGDLLSRIYSCLNSLTRPSHQYELNFFIDFPFLKHTASSHFKHFLFCQAQL